MHISNIEDSFINDQKEHTTRWVVKLDNDEDVYFDDNRPGLNEHSSWSRLKQYCESNNRYIKNMYLQFRSHYENVEPNKEGYFFSKLVRGTFHSKRTEYFYLVGYLENNTVYIKKYSVPALILRDEFTRTFEECKDLLIWQKKE